MGYNTTVVVLNDALGEIARDPEVGKKLASAVHQVVLGKPVTVSAGNHCNPILVVETHHADRLVPVLVGGNYGYLLDRVSLPWNSEDHEHELLRVLAKKHGYTLSRRGKKS